MLDDAFVDEADAGLEEEVALDLFPGELEFVFLGPDVFAGAAECVAIVGGVVGGRAVIGDGADVAVVFEDSDWLRGRCGCGARWRPMPAKESEDGKARGRGVRS